MSLEDIRLTRLEKPTGRGHACAHLPTTWAPSSLPACEADTPKWPLCSKYRSHTLATTPLEALLLEYVTPSHTRTESGPIMASITYFMRLGLLPDYRIGGNRM